MLAVFCDLETSGLDFFRHHILEIALKIVNISINEELCHYESIIKQPQEVLKNADPQSLIINGFDTKKIAQGKDIVLVREEIVALFKHHNIQRGKAVFICQNPNFDRAFFSQLISSSVQEELKFPYHWLDLASMYWVLKMKDAAHSHTSFPQEFNLSKNAIAKHYHLPEETLPHHAMNGVNHLILCYQQVIAEASS